MKQVGRRCARARRACGLRLRHADDRAREEENNNNNNDDDNNNENNNKSGWPAPCR